MIRGLAAVVLLAQLGGSPASILWRPPTTEPRWALRPRVLLPSDSTTALRDTTGLASPRDAWLYDPPGLFTPRAAATTLSMDARLGLTPRVIRLSRYQAAIYGADRGAFLGLSAGVLGAWSGLWEERKAWYLMGAGAALGAIWGGLGPGEKSRIQIGFSAEPDEH